MADAPARGTGRLAENIVHFARALRKAGLRVGPGAVVDAIQAAEAAGIGDRHDFYWVLHSTLVKRHEDREVFDQAFRIFWRKRALLERMMTQVMAPTPAVPDRRKDQVNTRVAEALLEEEEVEQPPRPE